MEKIEYIYFYDNKGIYGEFSQFYSSEFYDNVLGIKFKCAEQYMMYNKAILFGDNNIGQQILQSNEPSKMKRLGRQIKNFDEKKWNNVKKQIVFRGNYLKFSQNKKLCDILLGTGNKCLAEASSRDNIWGIGINLKDASKGILWRGQNLLGNILMEVRDSIKNM